MKNNLIYIFLLLCLVPDTGFTSVAGNKDRRQVIGWVGEKPAYVDKLSTTKNVWNTKTYNNYVCVGAGKGCASGEFISPKHILTNAHVVARDEEDPGCGYGNLSGCTIQTSDGKTLNARVVFSGAKNVESFELDPSRTDWVVLEITDKNFCSPHYFGYVSPTPVSGNMWRAGFGQLRVMTDAEFDAVRKAFAETLRKNNTLVGYVANRGTVDLSGFPVDYSWEYFQYSIIKQFLAEFSALTDKNFINDFLYDRGTLKLIKNCAILEKTGNGARHSCRSWPGDSGSSIQNSSNQITLLHNSGYSVIGGYEHLSFGLPTEHIFSKKVIDALKHAKENCGKKPATKPDPITEPKPEPKPDPDPKSQLNERDIGATCIDSHLPPHATAGHYIKSGLKKYDCANGQTCSCAATECESGYYLVINASGNSQGWCYTRRCPSGKRLNIIDGYKTDTKCVDN